MLNYDSVSVHILYQLLLSSNVSRKLNIQHARLLFLGFIYAHFNKTCVSPYTYSHTNTHTHKYTHTRLNNSLLHIFEKVHMTSCILKLKLTNRRSYDDGVGLKRDGRRCFEIKNKSIRARPVASSSSTQSLGFKHFLRIEVCACANACTIEFYGISNHICIERN